MPNEGGFETRPYKSRHRARRRPENSSSRAPTRNFGQCIFIRESQFQGQALFSVIVLGVLKLAAGGVTMQKFRLAKIATHAKKRNLKKLCNEPGGHRAGLLRGASARNSYIIFGWQW